MLFGNRFEKALFDRYIIKPFDGYVVDNSISFFDILCDFCSSVAHNGFVFPCGIKKQDYAKVFYSSYALGTILSCSANEKDGEKISGGAVKAFANTAKQYGMSHQQVVDRLSYITASFDNMLNAMDNVPPEKEGAYVAMSFLNQVGVKPTEENVRAMFILFDKYKEAFLKWDAFE